MHKEVQKHFRVFSYMIRKKSEKGTTVKYANFSEKLDVTNLLSYNVDLTGNRT